MSINRMWHQPRAADVLVHRSMFILPRSEASGREIDAKQPFRYALVVVDLGCASEIGQASRSGALSRATRAAQGPSWPPPPLVRPVSARAWRIGTEPVRFFPPARTAGDARESRSDPSCRRCNRRQSAPARRHRAPLPPGAPGRDARSA